MQHPIIKETANVQSSRQEFILLRYCRDTRILINEINIEQMNGKTNKGTQGVVSVNGGGEREGGVLPETVGGVMVIRNAFSPKFQADTLAWLIAGQSSDGQSPDNKETVGNLHKTYSIVQQNPFSPWSLGDDDCGTKLAKKPGNPRHGL